MIQLVLAKEAQDAIEARELAKLTYKRPQRQTALTRRAGQKTLTQNEANSGEFGPMLC